MPNFAPKSKSISSVTLHSQRPIYLRANVVPFVFIHAAVLYLAITNYEQNEVFSFLSVPISLLLHMMTFLFSYWFIDVDCFINYKTVSSVEKATNVKVVPKSHKGEKEFVPLQKLNNEYYFFCQQRKYSFDTKSQIFTKIVPQLDHKFGHYKEYPFKTERGDDWVQVLSQTYGSNTFEIPMPTFRELYKEQALAPFFVFQIFCVGLWLLDEHWIYAIFILVMLLFFEGTVVHSRLKNLQSLRNMVHPPQDVQVLRNKKWKSITSKELVPGDICFLPPKIEEPLPADFLLLSGTCITNEAMLTGESTPQFKEPISNRDDNDLLSMNMDSLHILFGGTRILQTGADRGNKDFKVGENGCVCFTLRTGFNTSQGKLVRTILYSTKRVTANNWESFVFICFLLCFGLAASGYVLMKGLEMAERSRYKLLVECCLILTSTVPPELPTELSLAVNNSLANLQKLKIFCTEPFRIPTAGKIDYCCFDKTGTLTDEHLVLRGVSGIDKGDLLRVIKGMEVHFYNEHATHVMAGCHSLTYFEKETVGDPMELAALYGVRWFFTYGDVAVSRLSDRRSIKILQRFHFSSMLSRMSTIVLLEIDDQSQLLGLVKGAPEVIMKRLAVVPQHYQETYLRFASQGKRVIAMAYKVLPKTEREQVRFISRETVESDLIFCGFLLFECPLKPDSQLGIETLISSSHKVVMITGDNPLTACQVSVELGITSKPQLILEKSEEEWNWVSLESNVSGKLNIALPRSKNQSFLLLDRSVYVDFDLCLYGEGLAHVLQHPQASKIVPHVKVVARSSPENKSRVLVLLKSLGYTTLMCGDGTNDVGALKQAHVGVALLNNLPPVIEEDKESKKDKKEQQLGLDDNVPKGTRAKRARVKHTEKPEKKVIKVSKAKAQKLKKNYLARMEELKLEAENDPKLVSFGDASIASPFTAKSSSVLSIHHIIRQGRCTLIQTRQMFSILALNCLVHAYGLSVLYLDGIKMGDTQATITGFLIATCFICITYSKPLEQLSPKKPLPGLFSAFLFLSVLLQFGIHLYSMIYIVNAATAYQTGEKPLPDSDFKPSLVNSAIFLLTTSMQVSNFATNYIGHPYMQSLRENTVLFRCLIACEAVAVIAALELVPPFNDFIELVRFPAAFKAKLLMVMMVDFVLAYVSERLCRKIFASSSL